MKYSDIFTDPEIIQMPVGRSVLTALTPNYGTFHTRNSSSYLQVNRYLKERPPLNIDIELFTMDWAYNDVNNTELLGMIALTGLLTLSKNPIQCADSFFKYIRSELDEDRNRLLQQHEDYCRRMGSDHPLPEAMSGPTSVSDVSCKVFSNFKCFKTLLSSSASETGYQVYFIPLNTVSCLQLSFSPHNFKVDRFESKIECCAFIEQLCDEFISKLTLSDGNFTQAAPPPKLEPSPKDLPDNSW
ncbi:hypothetical protein [Simiduia aestuariiviva]|uniref:Uncharacterized protein n=1 Tax=Simiduia aestuariiviva TaxID=1510459 RepID=A0A839UNY8_9GAMM|nr:hypothetical protein [Simiduia aestuariiviva]MBB3169542.1 hypothetical protein [Simiduia aestuariiviva]